MTDDERVIQGLVANTSRKFCKHFLDAFSEDRKLPFRLPTNLSSP